MSNDHKTADSATGGGPKLLRPEGRILAWDQLTEDQRRAVKRILAALREAVERGSGKDRRSQVYFLHGARGTGKSSLIVSLVEAFEKRGASLWERSNDDSVRLANVNERLGRLRDPVIWLNWIDMDPLPRSTHLMSAVLARIEHVAVKHRGAAPMNDVDEVVSRFRRVQIEAAEAWEANIREKAGTTDLEVYAGDVTRSERKKIELHAKIEKALDEICERVLGKPRAMFVLPVDDFDLNAAHSVELIELIRSLALSRLFTLVLGDIDVASHVFYLSKRGDLVKKGRLEATAVTHDTDVVAGESAAAAIRKLIPPEQVLKLDLVPLERARLHQPFEGRPPLKEMLAQIPIWLILPGYDPATGPAGSREGEEASRASAPEHEWCRRSLGAFLFGAPGEVTFPHPAAELLRSSARYLTDLWMALDILSHEEEVRPLEPEDKKLSLPLDKGSRPEREAVTKFAVRLFERAVAEDAGLTTEERRVFREAVHYNDVSGEWELDIGHFEVRSRFGTPLELRLKPGLSVVAHRIIRWEARVKHTEVAGWKDSKTSRRLGDRTVGALCLLYDLLLLQDVGSVPVVVSDASMQQRAFARWSMGGEPFDVPWFSDIWSTFWETSLFIDTWNRVKRRARELANQAGWMTLEDISMYLRCGWALAGLWVLSEGGARTNVHALRDTLLEDKHLNTLDEKDKHPSTLPEPKKERTIFKALKGQFIPALKGLAESVGSRFEDRKDDRVTDERIAWLVALGGVFAPECGCFVADADSSTSDEKAWRSIIADIHKIVGEGYVPSEHADGTIVPPEAAVKDAWDTRVTSRVVEKRLERLFSHRPWNPALLWFLDPESAARAPIESPLANREAFGDQPANGSIYLDHIRLVLKLACLRAGDDPSATTIREALDSSSPSTRETTSPRPAEKAAKRGARR